VRGFGRTAAGEVAQESALVTADPELFYDQASGFIHERMLKGAGISIKRGSFKAQSPSSLPPASYGGEHLPQNFLRFNGLEPKTRGSRQRTGDGRFFLVLRDGGLAHAGTIHFRHRVEVIGR
jgi:hypothetical protein